MKKRSDWGMWLFIVLIGVGCSWLYFVVAYANRGDVLALAGSLIMLLPPVQQLITNFRFHVALKKAQKQPALKELADDVKKLRVTKYVRFSWVDAGCYVVGPLIMGIGFLMQISFR